ncbi:SHOCT domain-containing protein [Actinoplanes sp. G11-F43]|uniref:SHOCT domain-containing protein n=1 Tax=Actinoplanes sp. G11-F43 TaxID=3424130 RepID=UPI003D333C45
MTTDDGLTVPDHCARALAKAQRAGVDAAGALAVAHSRTGGADLYLLIYPDRLELASPGTLMGTGAGRERIPLSTVTQVTARDRLFRSSLEITAAGNTLSFPVDRPAAAHLAALITRRRSAAPDNSALLEQLAALHTAGVLTDEEYAEKRATLLGD